MAALYFTLTACNSNKQVRCDCEQLKKEIDSLRLEVERYKIDPNKLLAQAEAFYKQQDVFGLGQIHMLAQQHHPEAKATHSIKALVEQLRKFKEAEIERLHKLKQDSIAKAEAARLAVVKRLKKNYDDVSGTIWYEQPYFVHYNSQNLASLYIGENDKSVWLRLKMTYAGADWIFFKNAYLSYDGKTLEVVFNEYKDKETQVSSGVQEWIDVSVDNSMFTYLKEFVQAKEPKMRLSGKYTRTRTLSTNEIKGMRDVLLAYEVLKEEKTKTR